VIWIFVDFSSENQPTDGCDLDFCSFLIQKSLSRGMWFASLSIFLRKINALRDAICILRVADRKMRHPMVLRFNFIKNQNS
jgi:hypothetical protein